MAKPTTFSGSQMLILVGDGASPEVFTAPCGLTTKGLNRTADTADTTVPDCDDPSAPAWTESEVISLSWEASGSGVLASESVQMWETWFASGHSKNVKVHVKTGANAGRSYAGTALLTAFNVSGERGQKVTVEVTLKGTGVLTPSAITA